VPDLVPLYYVIIGSIIGPAFIKLLEKLLGKKTNEVEYSRQLQGMVSDALKDADKAIDDLRNERELNKAEIKELNDRITAMEAIEHGPFRLTIEFTTHPLAIHRQRIEVIASSPKPPDKPSGRLTHQSK